MKSDPNFPSLIRANAARQPCPCFRKPSAPSCSQARRPCPGRLSSSACCRCECCSCHLQDMLTHQPLIIDLTVHAASSVLQFAKASLPEAKIKTGEFADRYCEGDRWSPFSFGRLLPLSINGLRTQVHSVERGQEHRRTKPPHHGNCHDSQAQGRGRFRLSLSRNCGDISHLYLIRATAHLVMRRY